MSVSVKGMGGVTDPSTLSLTKKQGFYNETDNQSQAATKDYTYSLTAGKTYILTITSASTGNHSSSISVNSGTVTKISDINQGNGIRLAMLYASTSAEIKVTITAKSASSRNATGLVLAELS